MIQIIELLQTLEYYGGGKHIEIAKGKHEKITKWWEFKIKIKRLWLLRSK